MRMKLRKTNNHIKNLEPIFMMGQGVKQGVIQKMNVLVKISLLITITVLSACTISPTPYEVVESTSHAFGNNTWNFSEGITERVISDTEVIITAKLSDSSTEERALAMVRYHAALMAQKAGYTSIQRNSESSKVSCLWSNRSILKEVYVSAKGRYSFNNMKTNPHKGFFNVVIAQKRKFKEFNVNYTQEQLRSIQSAHVSHCERKKG